MLEGPGLSAASDPIITLMTSVSAKMTTEKSLVAEAENPPKDQKPEGKEQEEAGPCKTNSEDTNTEEKQDTEQTQGSPSTASPRTRKSKDRNSEGKGLSRLFSSFLKKQKSQVTEEGKDSKQPEEKADGDQKDVDEGLGELEDDVFLKAPIAAPEPELRTDPSLDLHSLSSAETQPAQEDRKDDQDQDVDLEERESTAKGNKERESDKADAEVKSPQKVAKKSPNMRCKVSLLDDTLYECELEKHAKGQDIFKKVCSHLNIMEEDYFGLAIWESPTTKTWMDPVKDIRKQVHGAPWEFTFNVKFYPPDPAQLMEDITRYYLCLQLRQDILSGRLPCSFATLALLGSYTVQSEVGDYDEDLHGTDYVSEFKLSPNQTKDLEAKVAELHKSYRSMTPAQADLEFLENAKKLTMYGLDIHHAKDLEGVDIKLGVCSGGLMVFKDNLRINRFPWPKVLKISYKRSSFFIKIRPGEQEQYESTIGFKLPSYRAAKKLWKVCVEHHTFFRLTSAESIPKQRFLSLGSKFRYSGRTQAQTRHASALIDRPAPQFERTASKRASHSLDGAKKKHASFELRTQEDDDNDVEVFELENPFSTVSSTVSHKEEITFKNSDQSDLKRPEELNGVEQLHIVDVETKQPAAVPTPERNPRPVSAPVITPGQVVVQSTPSRESAAHREASSAKFEDKKTQERTSEPRNSPKDVKRSPQGPPSPTVNGEQVQQPSEKEEDIIRMRKPPLVKTQTVTISNPSVAEKGQIPTKEVPLVHTETKTITYEAAKSDDVNNDGEPGILLTAHTVTSETTSSTTTTQITKTVKGGISETRIEKRIVITGDGDLDHDQVLVQAIKEAKEQHPDMSVTKVVVHQETEIAEE
ncbi:protein 4.1 isoform X17 [Rana temporaria]|uniref:protein 4.1 isoform X17 n=1 Tax=Rana temporaria TaxID=8407 RepID=UPI001AADEE55|nr:protein 4.1 isoform X17 [Rana temporaria]